MNLTTQEISHKLRQLRIRAKFTQEQLADYIGLTASTISKIENGHQTPDAVTYENWLWVCNQEVVRFTFYFDGRSKQHA